MKVPYISGVILFLGFISADAQNKPGDLPFFSTENLEFTALKPSFRLIRHEYILLENGNIKTRGGNDYYGKTYTIGVLDNTTRLWYPDHIKVPWLYDETFDKQLLKNLTPKCSVFGLKEYNDQDYFLTKLQETNSNFLRIGKTGIPLEDTIRNEGTLVIFYTAAASPDEFSVISYSLVPLRDIEWSREGICEIDELQYGNNKTIGGALFSRYISPGTVNWKLIGFYQPSGNKWIIKAINPNNITAR